MTKMFEPITEVVGVRYEGERLPLEPRMARFLIALQHGPAHWRIISRSNGAATVAISRLREFLRDIGFPLTIRWIVGSDGMYRFVEDQQSLPPPSNVSVISSGSSRLNGS